MRGGDGASPQARRPGWRPVRAPAAGRQSGSRPQSCNDPRPGLRMQWRGGAPVQSGTSDAGREDRGPGRDAAGSPSSDPPPPRGERGDRECSRVRPPRGHHPLPPTRPVCGQGLWMVAEEVLPLRKALVSLKTDSVIACGACGSPLTLRSGVHRGTPRSWASLPRSSSAGRSLVGGRLQTDWTIPPHLRPEVCSLCTSFWQLSAKPRKER